MTGKEIKVAREIQDKVHPQQAAQTAKPQLTVNGSYPFNHKVKRSIQKKNVDVTDKDSNDFQQEAD